MKPSKWLMLIGTPIFALGCTLVAMGFREFDFIFIGSGIIFWYAGIGQHKLELVK